MYSLSCSTFIARNLSEGEIKYLSDGHSLRLTPCRDILLDKDVEIEIAQSMNESEFPIDRGDEGIMKKAVGENQIIIKSPDGDILIKFGNGKYSEENILGS